MQQPDSSQPNISLAIETSGRVGRIALGQGNTLLASQDLPQKRRHNIDLMQTIDTLFTQHQLDKSDLSDIYISTGPGSFTGLRIGITTAKFLASILDLTLVEVPTLEVVMHNCDPASLAPTDRVAACLNLKHDTVYAAVWERDPAGHMNLVVEPALQSPDQLLAAAGPNLTTIVGELLPEQLLQSTQHRIITGPDAHPQADITWHIGRRLRQANQTISPKDLKAAYIREPEAVTLWNMRHGPQK